MESPETKPEGVDSPSSATNEDPTSDGNFATTTAMNELEKLYATDSDAERVSLRGLRVAQDEADDILVFVQKNFPRLRHLDLRDNDLYELPSDFGSRLPRLVALNLLNNNFRFRNGALRTLAETLQHCPCLKSLSISLSSPAEEQMLLAMLPRLRILNGTPLPSTRADNETANPASPTLQELQQFCASPAAKVSMKSSNANVKREDKAIVSRSTSAVPQKPTKNSVRPRDLPTSISDDRTDWRKMLKPARAQVMKAQINSEATSAAVVSTETFLQQLKAVVKTFHECDSKAKINSSKVKLFVQLDRHVEQLAQQLKRQEPNNGRTELSEAMLQTRWSLLEVCAMFGSQKVAQVDAGLGNGFGMLLAMQKQLLSVMQKQQQSGTDSSTQKSNGPQTQKQLKALLDVAEGLESDLEAVQLQLQKETTRREQIEQENLELKRGLGEGKTLSKIATSKSTESRERSRTNTVNGTAKPSRRIRKRADESSLDTTTDPVEDIREPESTRIDAPPAPDHTTTISVRNLSLKQLVDLIQCVYASKVKYDARATTAGAPRETMEQHLYTYLNTRFGLPKLIVDYASAVWKAAEHFAHRENDAAVFVALLRNRLDEGFLEIKRKLQSALVELLRAFFTAKYPKKQGKAIAALVQSRIDGLIEEEEWRNLLTYLYEPQDSAALIRLVHQRAEKYQTQRQKIQPTEKPSLSLPFTDFEHILYSYQLQGRLDLLDGFRTAFDELDTERVGVINQARFFSLTRRLAPSKSESVVTKLVETLDPFNHDVITFSDAANALLPDIRRGSARSDSQTKTKKAITGRRN